MWIKKLNLKLWNQKNYVCLTSSHPTQCFRPVPARNPAEVHSDAEFVPGGFGFLEMASLLHVKYLDLASYYNILVAGWPGLMACKNP